MKGGEKVSHESGNQPKSFAEAYPEEQKLIDQNDEMMKDQASREARTPDFLKAVKKAYDKRAAYTASMETGVSSNISPSDNPERALEYKKKINGKEVLERIKNEDSDLSKYSTAELKAADSYIQRIKNRAKMVLLTVVATFGLTGVLMRNANQGDPDKLLNLNPTAEKADAEDRIEDEDLPSDIIYEQTETRIEVDRNGYDKPGLWLDGKNSGDYGSGDKLAEMFNDDDKEIIKYVAANELPAHASYVNQMPDEYKIDALVGLTGEGEIFEKMKTLSDEQLNEQFKLTSQFFEECETERIVIDGETGYSRYMAYEDENGNLLNPKQLAEKFKDENGNPLTPDQLAEAAGLSSNNMVPCESKFTANNLPATKFVHKDKDGNVDSEFIALRNCGKQIWLVKADGTVQEIKIVEDNIVPVTPEPEPTPTPTPPEPEPTPTPTPTPPEPEPTPTPAPKNEKAEWDSSGANSGYVAPAPPVESSPVEAVTPPPVIEKEQSGVEYVAPTPEQQANDVESDEGGKDNAQKRADDFEGGDW